MDARSARRGAHRNRAHRRHGLFQAGKPPPEVVPPWGRPELSAAPKLRGRRRGALPQPLGHRLPAPIARQQNQGCRSVLSAKEAGRRGNLQRTGGSAATSLLSYRIRRRRNGIRIVANSVNDDQGALPEVKTNSGQAIRIPAPAPWKVRERRPDSRSTVPPLLSRSARHAAKPSRMACSQSAAVRTPTS